MSDIQNRVKAIIVDKLGVDESEVKPEATFTNDLGADSLDTVELIMELEKNSTSLFRMIKQRKSLPWAMLLHTLKLTLNNLIFYL